MSRRASNQPGARRLFGDPVLWPNNDLIELTMPSELTAQNMLAAYREGVFPMPIDLSDHPDVEACGWFSPTVRGILPLDELRVTRSLRKTMKRYRTSVDAAFDEVVRRCADPDREFGWIDDTLQGIYQSFHDGGHAHSVETWDEQGRLVGGLFGVSIGGLFCGESMFHDPELGRDASKTALVRLVHELGAEPGERLLDVQWATKHLSTLGVREISRDHYLQLLPAAMTAPGPSWGRPLLSPPAGPAPAAG